jgi:transposase
VGLAVLASETGHVPLFHRTYPGNASDQSVLGECLDDLGRLHDALDAGEGRKVPAERTLVRDGGFWSDQLELELDVMGGYYSIISLPLSHSASAIALEQAARHGAMKRLGGSLHEVRAFRLRTNVGEHDRTLVVVESRELLEGHKRGIAAALVKARKELRALERRVAKGNLTRTRLEQRVKQTLRREHLSEFVVCDIDGDDKTPSFHWHIDAARRRTLDRTRLGKRVICTDRHGWRTERIVQAFRGQWNVEEIFRRTKKGGVVPWGPSFQWADASLRLHTFATVLGLMLVALAKLALGTKASPRAMMRELAGIRATLVRRVTQRRGRPVTYELAPAVTALQANAIRVFELARWMPTLSACRPTRTNRREIAEAA